MPTENITPPRAFALHLVNGGHVVHQMGIKPRVRAEYQVTMPMASRPPTQPVFVWLRSNGYIRHDAPNLRGTRVVLTKKGEAVVAAHAELVAEQIEEFGVAGSSEN